MKLVPLIELDGLNYIVHVVLSFQSQLCVLKISAVFSLIIAYNLNGNLFFKGG